MRDRPPRMIAAALLAFLSSASGLRAQANLDLFEDASTPPRGFFRFRPIVVWTRYDSRFTPTGVEPLGGFFTTDSLGPAQLPSLLPTQSLVQSASALPFTLTMGRSQLGAAAREETVPLALEYGVTNRLSILVAVPIVRKRVAVQFRLNNDTTGFTANVGPNLQRTSVAAAENNRAVQTEFASAAAALQSRIASCSADPSGAGCATVLAEGPQLLQESQMFAGTLAALYGSSTSNGMAFVPLDVSVAQVTIAARVADFNARFQSVLGETTSRIVAVPRGAGGPPGVANVQDYLVRDLGRDSLTSREWVGIGDVAIGFKLKLINRQSIDRRRPSVQLAVAGGVRLPTGSRQSFSDIIDMRLGEGSVIADTRATLDAQSGRFGLVAAGTFSTSVDTRDTTIADPNSSWMLLQVAPRYHLSTPFAIHGAYSLQTTDKLGSQQLVGGGVSYSTHMRYVPGKTPPWEARYTHLEAITGSEGRPKLRHDQIEMRIYFRVPGL